MATPADAAFQALVAQGNRARFAGDAETAEGAYRRALAMRPDNAPVAANLGLLLLSVGRYAEGWPLYEARRKVTGPDIPPPAGIPEWRGEPLAGRSLLIWPEQGLGDEIQMARFAPVLRDMGARVSLVCAPPLARLFRSLKVQVAPLTPGAKFPRTHFHSLAMSLPGRLGATLETLPAPPYLRAPAGPRRGGVGFVWKGNPEHPNDAARSLPSPAVLDPLAEVCELVDLQTPVGDFLDAATRIQGLDLVITVDTAMAHLAGALGVPCWVMLPAHWTDWRWLRAGETSAWYPSLKLYRQAEPGDWAGVVARMRDDLARG
ncbi:MAG TPA: hypothetical protein VFW47_16835 [Phenylobacterium sp.]|nr:hypothetical protein [Phenylobacterium sp.]